MCAFHVHVVVMRDVAHTRRAARHQLVVCDLRHDVNARSSRNTRLSFTTLLEPSPSCQKTETRPGAHARLTGEEKRAGPLPGTSIQSTLTRSAGAACGGVVCGANVFLLPARSFARLGALLASPARPSTLSGRGEAALGAAFVAESLSASASRAVPRLTASAGFGAVALIFAVFAVAVLPAGASCGCRAAVVLIEFRSVAAVGALQSA